MHHKRHELSKEEEHSGRHRRHHDHGGGAHEHDGEYGRERGHEHGHGEGRRHGGHGGRHGFRHHGLESSRKVTAADLQLILISLLADKPAHGYELIKALDDHSHGLYAPSPGMIYPALTYLEEIGYASVTMEGSKKRYNVTETGREYLDQNRETAQRILSEMERIGTQMEQARQAVENGELPENCEDRVVNDELESARYELRGAQHKKGPYTADEARRIADILKKAAAEIRQFITSR